MITGFEIVCVTLGDRVRVSETVPEAVKQLVREKEGEPLTEALPVVLVQGDELADEL